jgi:hypothetical protein
MFFSHEVAEPTEHPKILRARNGQAVYGSAEAIDQLIDAARSGAGDASLRHMLHEIVPDFTSGVNGNGRGPACVSQPAMPTLDVLPRLVDERGDPTKGRRAPARLTSAKRGVDDGRSPTVVS